MRKLLLTTLLAICTLLSAQVTITMEQDGGVYKVPCIVNGAKMKFIFDTGAATVCLSESMAEYLLDNDYITKEDILGTGTSQVADGRIVDHVKINLRDIEIAGLHLKDVEAVVVEGQRAPLLLGQSAIQKIGKVSIEGNKLIIENGNDGSCVVNSVYLHNIPFVELESRAKNSIVDKEGLYAWMLGDCYRIGICVPVNETQAAYWYSIAAQKGNHDAEEAYGDCLYRGIGVKKDYARAVYWFEQAAKFNHARALYNLGFCYGHGQGVQEDIDKGFQLTVKAANSNVGASYEDNNRFAKEELKNYFNRYYDIVTNNGNGVSCFYLALCYDNGYGTTVDKQEALKWYTKGAEKGNYASMNNLGLLYEKGVGGIKKDMITAMYWYKKAAKEDKIAQRNLGKRYFYATNEIKQDLVESLYWFKCAADNGDYVSQKWVADFYRYGWGIERNSSSALEMYKAIYNSLYSILNSSAEERIEMECQLTYNEVCFAIGGMYALGEGCSKNIEKSVEWILLCKDYGKAYTFLSSCYEDGRGVEKDFSKALQLLLKNRNAKWKYAGGLNMLAYRYAEGKLGLTKSIEMALEIIDEAIELDPADPDYYDSKGEFYSMQGKYNQAKEMWLKAKALDSNYYTNNNTELNKYIKKQVK